MSVLVAIVLALSAILYLPLCCGKSPAAAHPFPSAAKNDAFDRRPNEQSLVLNSVAAAAFDGRQAMPTTHHLSSAADAVSGASSIERLATEIALAGQTRKFKTLCF